jgi:CubicO group peptidase (beta-lactamase class C family)
VRNFRWLTMAVLLVCYLASDAWSDSLEELVNADSIDCVMDAAMQGGLISGGVVIVGNSAGEIFTRPYGRTSLASSAHQVTIDTIFDLASLTKVIATTPSIMKLVDEGKLDLRDPVTKWFPEFVGKGKDDLIILHLLTHTSGMADFALPGVNPLHAAVEGAANQVFKTRPGTRFRYADINFILLGELVRRVSGITLDRYATARIYAPLAMGDTAFNPDEKLRIRCAATLGYRDVQYGMVQDPNARQLGGVAGHAGLFGSAIDVSRYCRMLLRGGELEGSRVLSEEAVLQMDTPFVFHEGKVVRGVGWDMVSPYSSPKGAGFSGASFGHTGYSGCSVWIDPESDIYVILLTSRLDYRKIRDFNRLRGNISTLAASLFARDGKRRGNQESVVKSDR